MSVNVGIDGIHFGLLFSILQSKKSDMVPPNAGNSIGIQDSKKTCNLETYLEWSARLRSLVANEILLVRNTTKALNVEFCENTFRFQLKYRC